MIKTLHLIFLLPVSFLLTSFCFAQLEVVDSLINSKNYGEALLTLDSIKYNKLPEKEQGLFYFLKGKGLLSIDDHGVSFTNLIKAREIYLNLKLSCEIAEVDLLIIELLSHQKLPAVDDKPYLDEFIEESEKCGKPIDKAKANAKLAVKFLDADRASEAIYHFNTAIKIASELGDTLNASNFTFNKGVVYNTTLKKYDSALYFFKKVLPVYQRMNQAEYISYNYNNQAEAYKKLENYSKAIQYYKKADSIPLKQYNLKTKIIFYSNMTDLYKKMNNPTLAFEYLQKLDSLKDEINETGQNVSMAEIKEQYDNEKLRADNLESEAKRTQNRNIAIGLGGGILAVAIFAFLIFKNTKRKQHIAEQQREIEIQKTEKILKEQELTSIDAMVAGQEKERQRLASDLHDNVGATLSATRLQFEHLKKNRGNLPNENELFDNVGSLIENAQTEVRAMAHLKNSGVIAKKGLLPAVEKLAKNASGMNNLFVEVQDFGLDEPLHNSLEITVFRIIQELITNVIKHSKASEASISITHHSDSLNIIVEDNGIGFDTRKFSKFDGMGLSSVEKRVEHLEGTMEVDSMPDKGTSILIDIPL